MTAICFDSRRGDLISISDTVNMPKYYCDYCDTYLTHDSPSVRKTHCTGRKHKDNVKFYYQKWMEQQVSSLKSHFLVLPER